MCIPTTDQATSPAAAVTSPRMSINYKKNRILCGLRWISGLFLRVLLVIFRNRKTPRFDACQKIAVRSWLNRNGVLNLELFNFAPTKPAVGKSFTAQASRLGVCVYPAGVSKSVLQRWRQVIFNAEFIVIGVGVKLSCSSNVPKR